MESLFPNTKDIKFRNGTSLYDYFTSDLFKSYAHPLVTEDGAPTFGGLEFIETLRKADDEFLALLGLVRVNA